MEPEKVWFTLGYIAGADLVKRRFVTAKGTYPDADGDLVRGVNVFDVQTGQSGTLNLKGVLWVVSGSAIALNAEITTDTEGRAIALPDTGTPAVLGEALNAVTGPGQIVAILTR